MYGGGGGYDGGEFNAGQGAGRGFPIPNGETGGGGYGGMQGGRAGMTYQRGGQGGQYPGDQQQMWQQQARALSLAPLFVEGPGSSVTRFGASMPSSPQAAGFLERRQSRKAGNNKFAYHPTSRCRQRGWTCMVSRQRLACSSGNSSPRRTRPAT